jgi:hypothetical protein
MGRFFHRKHIVFLILFIYASLIVVGSRRNSSGIDEAGHVAAGVAHWKTGSFSLYRVNPPLVDMVSALPVVLAGARTDYHRMIDAPGVRSEWNVGWDFAWINRDRYTDLLFLARLPGIVWSIAGSVLIYRWARELYGGFAGEISLIVWCFDPTVLAWVQAVTSDVPAATMGLAATYVFWHYLRIPSWSRAAASGLLLGCALLTKLTLLIFYGVWPILVLIHRPWRGIEDGRVRRRWLVGHALAILVLSLLVINLGYGFQGTGRRLGELPFVSRAFTGVAIPPGFAGNRFRGIWAGGLVIPVPADYLRGIDVQRFDFENRIECYLAGEWRIGGWWYYYLYALAVKEPLGTLLLTAWVLALTLLRHPSSAPMRDEWTWLLPAAVILGFVSAQTGYNHHMRYVLPAFPFMAVGLGKLAYFLDRRRWPGGLGVVLLLGWSLASSMLVFPHAMSYFNEAAGGPEMGSTHLNDSNVDWGQDLLYLREWLVAHPEAHPLGLAYYNYFDPRVVGIEFQLPPPARPLGMAVDPDRDAQFGPRPGYYAVSVNFLIGTKFLAPDGRGGVLPIEDRNHFRYFNAFRPIARAGYSIHIYHITREQADAARRASGLSPLPGPTLEIKAPERDARAKKP